MKIKDIRYHSQHPKMVWVVVEQPRDEPYRLKFDPTSETFYRTEKKCLGYERGSRNPYGWIGGSGTPPSSHLDVMFLTLQNPQPGEVLAGVVIGIFFRHDGDHKIVAIDETWAATLTEPDFSCLDADTYAKLISTYPRVGENEGWFGAETARTYLQNYDGSRIPSPEKNIDK